MQAAKLPLLDLENSYRISRGTIQVIDVISILFTTFPTKPLEQKYFLFKIWR